MKKQLVYLYGGPGTGKSTSCAGLYNLCKKSKINSEMSREYIKDWVWSKRDIKLGDQTYIMAKQTRQERIYMEAGVDVIITDSPPPLGILYGNKYDKYEREFKTCELMWKQHIQFYIDHGYVVHNVFLVREKEYNPAGRLQTKEEAIVIDTEILDMLQRLNIDYITLPCGDTVEQELFNIVMKN